MNLIIEEKPGSAASPISEHQISSLCYKAFAYNANQYLQNLQELDDFSKTIALPHVIGKFNSDEHYLKTLKLVLQSTLETHNRILFFHDKILPKLEHKNSFLDVGPGDGSLTLEVAKYFKSITAIDSNHYALDCLEKALHQNISLTKINKSIADVDMDCYSYDLMILSHVLYYVSSNIRLKIIESAYNGLKKNGNLVIILGGDELGKASLIEYFGGENLKIDQLALDCFRIFGANNVSLYASDEAFLTHSKEAMFHIAAFMLGDANISAKNDDLNRYIDRNFQLSENRFLMTTRQKFIIIKK
jgi:2-polyprenyl-3-methyl-5-hydroxy-6-metoxy-1,4-benzoquinol methylase